MMGMGLLEYDCSALEIDNGNFDALDTDDFDFDLDICPFELDTAVKDFEDTIGKQEALEIMLKRFNAGAAIDSDDEPSDEFVVRPDAPKPGVGKRKNDAGYSKAAPAQSKTLIFDDDEGDDPVRKAEGLVR